MLSAEQLAIRSKGVAASEVAAVAGLNPWRSPHEVWMEKTGRGEPIEENDAMRRGIVKESMIISWYRQQTGYTVSYAGRHQRTVVSAEYPLCIATPDGLVSPGRGLVEAKAPGRYTIPHWLNGEVPDYYVPQAIWQMAACGRPTWCDFAIDLGDELGVYRVDWDAELFGTLYEIVERFWRDHVQADTPPPADPTTGCTEALQRLYPMVQKPALMPADDHVSLLMLELQAAKEEEAAATKRKDQAANELRQLIGDGAGFESDIGKVTWKETKGRTKVDWQKIAEEIGAPDEIVERHTYQGKGHRTLRTYWRKQ